uniref:Oligosaccharyltransferase complex subunit n=1 Tax=Rhabditophanes sp. KR3021 TaxID=114890 RepID=A0AC35TMH6_9BILA
MDYVLEKTLFTVVQPPIIKVGFPKWIRLFSPMETFSLLLVLYFVMTAGSVFVVLQDVPSIGSAPDGRGGYRPVVIMPNRLNAQYGFEGFLAALMFTAGGLGFILLDKFHDAEAPSSKLTLAIIASTLILASYVFLRQFIFIKMPSYMG